MLGVSSWTTVLNLLVDPSDQIVGARMMQIDQEGIGW